MRGLLRIGGYRKECEVLIIKKPFFQKVLEILPKKHVFAKQKSSFLSTGSFFQTLGKFNQNASQKESVVT